MRGLAPMGVAILLASCAGQQNVVLDVAGSGNASRSVNSAHKAGWDLNWSYDCSSAGGHGVFIVDVYDSDRTPDFTAPGVNEEGDKDMGVYHVPGSGRFYLEVTSTCRWTLKAVEQP